MTANSENQDSATPFRALRIVTLVSGRTSGGALELFEDTRSAGAGPAPHVHRGSDEAFYVLAGGFSFVRGREEIEAHPGDVVFIPRGTRHCYRALAADSRLLIMYAPAGLEGFLRELDGLITSGLPGPEAMAALKGKFDSDPWPEEE